MPERYLILRGSDGGDPKTFRQGETNTNIKVEVSSEVPIDEHEQIIWNTAVGYNPLHGPAHARNVPVRAQGYIHSHSNKLFAVSKLDPEERTIEIVSPIGQVCGGVCIF